MAPKSVQKPAQWWRTVVKDTRQRAVNAIAREHAKWLHLSGKEGERANFCGANLDHLDLSNRDWSDAVFRDATLNMAHCGGCNFTRADLSGAMLTCARIDDAIFDETTLTGTYFGGVLFSPGAGGLGPFILYADAHRQYLLSVFEFATPEPIFIAGCRTFTKDEALFHWGPMGPSHQPDYCTAIQKWVKAHPYHYPLPKVPNPNRGKKQKGKVS